MITEFLRKKEKVNLKRQFPVDFDELNENDQKQYIRNQIKNEQRNNFLKGILTADIIKIDHDENDRLIVAIGWSLCKLKTKKRKNGNIFSKETGLKISYNRSIDYLKVENSFIKTTSDITRSVNTVYIPQSIKKNLHKFIQRCATYYKVDNETTIFPPWVYDFLEKYKTITFPNDSFIPDQFEINFEEIVDEDEMCSTKL